MADKIRPIYAGFNEFKRRNAQPVLIEVEKKIARLERQIAVYKSGCTWRVRVPRWVGTYAVRDVYRELSIFDWWNERLTLAQLKQMRTFLKEAIKLGYTGYVCFKVGASGCANGMWANKLPTVDGYSPKGEFLYRSFTPDYTYWDICDYTEGYGDDGKLLSKAVGKKFDELKTIKDLEDALKEERRIRDIRIGRAVDKAIEVLKGDLVVGC